MSVLPLILLLAASSGVATHYTIEVPRADWSYVDVVAPEVNAVVNCEFEVLSNDTEVRVLWIARNDLESFRSGARQRILASTELENSGRLRQLAPAVGDYALVVENPAESRSTVKVSMKVWVQPAAKPSYASSRRRLAVILASCIAFFGMVSFSALKLRSKPPRK